MTPVPPVIPIRLVTTTAWLQQRPAALAAADCTACHSNIDDGTTLNLFAHDVDHDTSNCVNTEAACLDCHAATVDYPLFTDAANNKKHDACSTCHTSATDLTLVANAAWCRRQCGLYDLSYARVDADELLNRLRAATPPERLRKAEAVIATAKTKDSLQAFRKLTHEVDGRTRIISDPPLIVPVDELFPGQDGETIRADMAELLAAYRESLVSDRRRLFDQYRFVDMARKVVGVGSVGTRAWILLFQGLNGQDPLFLQAKQAQSSVLEQYAGVSEYTNHGERVVAGQRLMQTSSDIFLGWQRTNGPDGVDRDYYLRQLRDWKASAEVEGSVPAGMAVYGQVCGWTLARAHARSGDRVAIGAYLGKSNAFEESVAEFSAAYADQNDKDHALLRHAIDNGGIEATEGV